MAELRCDSPAEILTAAIRATRAGAIRNSHDASRHPCASVNVPPAAVTKAAPRKVRNTTRRAFRPALPASDDEAQREDMRGFLPTISPEPAKRPATSHIAATIPVSLYKRISAADILAGRQQSPPEYRIRPYPDTTIPTQSRKRKREIRYKIRKIDGMTNGKVHAKKGKRRFADKTERGFPPLASQSHVRKPVRRVFLTAIREPQTAGNVSEKTIAERMSGRTSSPLLFNS